jgi:hypothetical protein
MSLGRNNQTWHEIVDDRSLEMDRVIAAKIRANPKLIQIALANIERWLANPDYSESNRQAVLEWRSIIANSSVGVLATLLESSSEEARRLRQSSPFCGILTPAERQAIFRKYAQSKHRAKLASLIKLRYWLPSENGVVQCSEKAGSREPDGCDAPGAPQSGGGGGTAAAGFAGG